MVAVAVLLVIFVTPAVSAVTADTRTHGVRLPHDVNAWPIIVDNPDTYKNKYIFLNKISQKANQKEQVWPLLLPSVYVSFYMKFYIFTCWQKKQVNKSGIDKSKLKNSRYYWECGLS